MAQLRRRNTAAQAAAEPAPVDDSAAGGPSTKSVTVDTTKGHLGVTLSNHDLGVAVDRADPADLIAKAGLAAGDVIVTCNGEEVPNHETALDIMGSANGRLVLTYYTAADAKAEAVRKAGPPLGWWVYAVIAVLVAGALCGAYQWVTQRMAENAAAARANLSAEIDRFKLSHPKLAEVHDFERMKEGDPSAAFQMLSEIRGMAEAFDGIDLDAYRNGGADAPKIGESFESTAEF